jgi:hypothetical protein
MLEGERPAPAPPARGRAWQRSPALWWALALAILTVSAVLSYALLRPQVTPAIQVVPQSVPVPPPPAPRVAPPAEAAPAHAEAPAQLQAPAEPPPSDPVPAKSDERSGSKRAHRAKAPRDRSIAEEPDF